MNYRFLVLPNCKTVAFLLVLLPCFWQTALAQDQANVPALPGLRQSLALDYPDKTQLSLISSGFEYTLSVDGEKVIREEDHIITHRVQLTAKLLSIRDNKGLQFSTHINGVYDYQDKSADSANSQTTPLIYHDAYTSPGKGESSKPITISKKLGLAHFAAPTWKIVNFPTTSTYVITNDQGRFTDTLTQEACFDIRIPDQASTNSTFAAIVREVEKQGHDMRLPLSGNIGPATFEVPWQGGAASGTFTIPVEALVTPSWIYVNTPAANKYFGNSSGEKHEDGLQVFPGTLTITWWLGPRPTIKAAPESK